MRRFPLQASFSLSISGKWSILAICIDYCYKICHCLILTIIGAFETRAREIQSIPQYTITWWALSHWNREEKSLRHVAMVATFLDENKTKTLLKKRICTVSNFIDLIQFHLICQMLTKFPWFESERTVSKFRKRKRKFLCSCCVHVLHEEGAWD